jgi:hypothetical protein
MSLVSKLAIRITIFVSLVAAMDSPADGPSSTVITFLPDSVLPKGVLSEFLEARRVADYRVVEVDSDALRQLIREAWTTSTDKKFHVISLPLVDQSTTSIELRGGGADPGGWQSGFASFFGNIAEDETSTVQCVIAPDASVNLTIRTVGKRYKLEKTSMLPFHIYWVRSDGFSRRVD